MHPRTMLRTGLLALLLSGCATGGGTPATPAGTPINARTQNQDLAAMCASIAPDLQSSAFISAFKGTPRLLMDGEFFTNEDAPRVNKNLLANRMRAELNNASRGRLQFIGLTPGAAADLRLGGRISSFSMPGSSGQAQTYIRVLLQMVDLETGVNVWDGSYEFAVSPADGLTGR